MDRENKRASYRRKQEAEAEIYSIDWTEEDGKDADGSDILVDRNLDLEEAVFGKIMKEALREAIGRLKVKERDFIMGYYLSGEDLTESEYAVLTNTTRDSVKSMKKRVLAKLKKYLEEHF